MSEHYSGNDPEAGCGMLMIVGLLALVMWAFAIAWALGAWL